MKWRDVPVGGIEYLGYTGVRFRREAPDLAILEGVEHVRVTYIDPSIGGMFAPGSRGLIPADDDVGSAPESP